MQSPRSAESDALGRVQQPMFPQGLWGGVGQGWESLVLLFDHWFYKIDLYFR